MGFADDFLKVKQFPALYTACCTAAEFYEQGKPKEGFPYVLDAFAELRAELTRRLGRDWETIRNDDFLTELSKRNYDIFLAAADARDITENLFRTAEENALVPEIDDTSMNPFYALVEETRKFAMYYVGGQSPNSIDEATLASSDGRRLSRDARNTVDKAFAAVMIVFVFAAGLVCLLLSTSPKFWYLFPLGLGAVAFAAFLLWAVFNVRKE